MKTDYDITKQFNEDLIKAYNRVAPKSWSQKMAYEKAVKEPAPRYYVSPKQAAQIISPMLRGDFQRVDMMMPNRRRMYYSLFNKVLELSEKRSFIGKSLFYIMQFAVTTPAPEFFIDFRKLRELRSSVRLGKIDEDGRTTRSPAFKRCYAKLKEKRERAKASSMLQQCCSPVKSAPHS